MLHIAWTRTHNYADVFVIVCCVCEADKESESSMHLKNIVCCVCEADNELESSMNLKNNLCQPFWVRTRVVRSRKSSWPVRVLPHPSSAPLSSFFCTKVKRPRVSSYLKLSWKK